MAKPNSRLIILLGLFSAFSVLSAAQSATAEELLLLSENNGEKFNTTQLRIDPVAGDQAASDQYLDVSTTAYDYVGDPGIVLAPQQQEVAAVNPEQVGQPAQLEQSVLLEQPEQIVPAAPLVNQATMSISPTIHESPFVWIDPPTEVASASEFNSDQFTTNQPNVNQLNVEEPNVDSAANFGIVIQPQVPTVDSSLVTPPMTRPEPLPMQTLEKEKNALVEAEKARIIENGKKVASRMNSTFACAAGVQYALSDAGFPEFMGSGDGWEMRHVFLNSPKWRVTDDPTKAVAFARAWTDEVVASFGNEYQGRNLGHVGILYHENGQPIELSDHKARHDPNASRYSQTIYFEYIG